MVHAVLPLQSRQWLTFAVDMPTRTRQAAGNSARCKMRRAAAGSGARVPMRGNTRAKTMRQTRRCPAAAATTAATPREMLLRVLSREQRMRGCRAACCVTRCPTQRNNRVYAAASRMATRHVAAFSAFCRVQTRYSEQRALRHMRQNMRQQTHSAARHMLTPHVCVAKKRRCRTASIRRKSRRQRSAGVRPVFSRVRACSYVQEPSAVLQ